MKKFVWVLLIVFSVCLLTAGCSSGTSGNDSVNPATSANSSQDTESQSNPGTEMTTGDPAETKTDDSSPTALPQPEQSGETLPSHRQFEYSLTELEELPTYSLQDLFAFYQGADGAFSEGAMAEMMERFSQDPSSFLSALAGAGQDLQALITNHLGVSIFFSGEYQDSLFDAQNLDLNEQQSTLLEYIIAAYESSTF